jgi:hypothetical protein
MNTRDSPGWKPEPLTNHLSWLTGQVSSDLDAITIGCTRTSQVKDSAGSRAASPQRLTVM